MNDDYTPMQNGKNYVANLVKSAYADRLGDTIRAVQMEVKGGNGMYPIHDAKSVIRKNNGTIIIPNMRYTILGELRDKLGSITGYIAVASEKNVEKIAGLNYQGNPPVANVVILAAYTTSF